MPPFTKARHEETRRARARRVPWLKSLIAKWAHRRRFPDSDALQWLTLAIQKVPGRGSGKTQSPWPKWEVLPEQVLEGLARAAHHR